MFDVCFRIDGGHSLPAVGAPFIPRAARQTSGGNLYGYHRDLIRCRIAPPIHFDRSNIPLPFRPMPATLPANIVQAKQYAAMLQPLLGLLNIIIRGARILTGS